MARGYGTVEVLWYYRNMLPHWYTVVRPLLLALDPGPVIEIGAYTGETTAHLAEIAVDRDTVLHVVDPAPQFDVAEFKCRFTGHVLFYTEQSHLALEEIEPATAVLIDGDHNWYTVHGELTRLESIAKSSGRRFPVVMFHDVEWPYARRDMYHDPEAIPKKWRRPWARRGLRWGERLLDENDGGFAASIPKAIEEGGPRNGVLTAIEDFVKESEISLELRIVSGGHGIGILMPLSLLGETPAVRFQWDKLHSPEFLLDHTRRLARMASAGSTEAGERIQRLERELARVSDRVKSGSDV